MTKIILPILSSRNKANGKYRILADGNWLAAFSRFEQMLINGEAKICVPEAWDDISEASIALSKLGIKMQNLLEVRYGEDIEETRTSFWDLQKPHVQAELMQDLYATGIPLPEYVYADTYLLNVSKHGISDKRPCAKHFAQDLLTIRNCLRTIVHDKAQATYLQAYCADNIIIDRPIASKALMQALHEKILLLPFRLNDASYGLLDAKLDAWQGKIIACNPTNLPAHSAEIKYLQSCGAIILPMQSKTDFIGLLKLADKIVYPCQHDVWHMLPCELEALGLSHKLCSSWEEIL